MGQEHQDECMLTSTQDGVEVREREARRGQGGLLHVSYLLISEGQRLMVFWFCVFRQLQSDVEARPQSLPVEPQSHQL